jgi:hypothetical protein
LPTGGWAQGTSFFTKIPFWIGLPTEGRMGGFRSEASGSLPAGLSTEGRQDGVVEII